VVAVVYAAVCVYLWSQQRALIFLPEPVVRHTPTEFGLPYEDVTIPIGDGDVLYGWWLPSRLTPSTPVTVLYLRGNDGNLGMELPRLQALHLHGLPILAVDDRGYSSSRAQAMKTHFQQVEANFGRPLQSLPSTAIGFGDNQTGAWRPRAAI
jgi:hypothetical protein